MNFLKKYVDPLVRLHSVLPLLSAMLVNALVYWGTMMLSNGKYHYDFTTDLDRMVPLLPWTVTIYLVCYLFWGINYILTGHLKKAEFYQFVTADMLSRVICAAFFLFLPTTNVRPDLPAESIFNPAMRWLWETDAPVNLFPSIHCLVSWFCYIGIRGKKQIPRWYQWFSCIFAIAVCVSTQTTKQHYLVDVLGGVAAAEFCYWLSGRAFLYKGIMCFFENINRRLGLTWDENDECEWIKR